MYLKKIICAMMILFLVMQGMHLHAAQLHQRIFDDSEAKHDHVVIVIQPHSHAIQDDGDADDYAVDIDDEDFDPNQKYNRGHLCQKLTAWASTLSTRCKEDVKRAFTSIIKHCRHNVTRALDNAQVRDAAALLLVVGSEAVCAGIAYELYNPDFNDLSQRFGAFDLELFRDTQDRKHKDRVIWELMFFSECVVIAVLLPVLAIDYALPGAYIRLTGDQSVRFAGALYGATIFITCTVLDVSCLCLFSTIPLMFSRDGIFILSVVIPLLIVICCAEAGVLVLQVAVSTDLVYAAVVVPYYAIKDHLDVYAKKRRALSYARALLDELDENLIKDLSPLVIEYLDDNVDDDKGRVVITYAERCIRSMSNRIFKISCCVPLDLIRKSWRQLIQEREARANGDSMGPANPHEFLITHLVNSGAIKRRLGWRVQDALSHY